MGDGGLSLDDVGKDVRSSFGEEEPHGDGPARCSVSLVSAV